MRHGLFALSLILLCGVSAADTLILSDGRVVEWKALSENGDVLEVTTTDGKVIVVRKEDVSKVTFTTNKGVLTGASFTLDSKKSGKPVNLLSILEPKKISEDGDWKLVSGSLVGRSAQSDTAYKVSVPFSPPEEYDIEADVTRKEGDSEIMFVVVAWGKQFAVHFDHAHGQGSGVSQVDGLWCSSSPTGKPGKVFSNGKQRTVSISVRKERLAVKVDNQAFYEWSEGGARLSLPAAHSPKSKDHLGIVIANAGYRVSRFTLIPKQ